MVLCHVGSLLLFAGPWGDDLSVTNWPEPPTSRSCFWSYMLMLISSRQQPRPAMSLKTGLQAQMMDSSTIEERAHSLKLSGMLPACGMLYAPPVAFMIQHVVVVMDGAS